MPFCGDAEDGGLCLVMELKEKRERLERDGSRRMFEAIVISDWSVRDWGLRHKAQAARQRGCILDLF
jgi:hypothetical protein